MIFFLIDKILSFRSCKKMPKNMLLDVNDFAMGFVLIFKPLCLSREIYQFLHSRKFISLKFVAFPICECLSSIFHEFLTSRKFLLQKFLGVKYLKCGLICT